MTSSESHVPIGQRLQFLIEHVYPRNGQPETIPQVARGIAKMGYPICSDTLTSLVEGSTQNPTTATISAIASYYKIPPSALTNDREWESLRAWLIETRKHLDSPNIRVARAWTALLKRRQEDFKLQ